jgi:hypothetical protein
MHQALPAVADADNVHSSLACSRDGTADDCIESRNISACRQDPYDSHDVLSRNCALVLASTAAFVGRNRLVPVVLVP